MEQLFKYLQSTGFATLEITNIIMVVVGLVLIFLGIVKKFEPLLLVPIGFGIVVGNMIPAAELLGAGLGVYDEGSSFYYIYQGVKSGIFPPLMFLSLGAMTDFGPVLSNPKVVLLGAAAQVGIFGAFLLALLLGFSPTEAGSIGIIGGADGPTAIFLTTKLSPELLGAIAISAYSYMALVPIIQPPIMKLLTNKKERKIKMRQTRVVSKREKILFPIVVFVISALVNPASITLIGMLTLGNLLKESGVTDKLAGTARTSMSDIVTILLGFSVGLATIGTLFLNFRTLFIFALGALAFIIATFFGVLFAKFINLFLKEENKINPLIGAAGVSAVPMAARVVHMVGQKEDP
ncbi:MAG: sodium ion-translocating decarboxylase subunit beta, partial [Spirochaetota bacterium]